jgi:catechol 2,3-dioxygenase-like lactoylglutathione lyase family enzyme
MELGAFSISLAVKDLAASRAFYEKLGFSVVAGEADQHWQILRNGTTTIGLFQGMFEQNILTFNPGWDAHGKSLGTFTDVRDLQKRLEEQGVEINRRADDTTDAPTSLVVVDPDGNPVLIDQHVPRPK